MGSYIWTFTDYGSGEGMLSNLRDTSEELAANLAEIYPKSIYFYADLVTPEI